MTQGRDGISLAHRAALRFTEVARQLSIAVAVFTCAAILASTAGRSYAQSDFCDRKDDRCLEDEIVVGNGGAILAGSVETFALGSHGNNKPLHEIKGANTGLEGTGVAGVAVDPFDGHIAVATQLDNIVERFSNGATGNSAPDSFLFGPDTGLDNPAGVAFGFTFLDCEVLATTGAAPAFGCGYPVDVLAVANTLGAVIQPGDFGFGLCSNPAVGFTLGTVTEYFTDDFGDAIPVNNSPVNFGTQNATIGGCATFMLGPTGIAFDSYGRLFVVQSFGGFVTEYESGAFGNVFPIHVIGVGDLIAPEFVAVGDGNSEIYVTDVGDDSVKIFGFDGNENDWFLAGVLQGRHTKLKQPMGIAISGDDLYVANNKANSILMFDDDWFDGGDISPTAKIRGKKTNLHQPTGLAIGGLQMLQAVQK